MFSCGVNLIIYFEGTWIEIRERMSVNVIKGIRFLVHRICKYLILLEIIKDIKVSYITSKIKLVLENINNICIVVHFSTIFDQYKKNIVIK